MMLQLNNMEMLRLCRLSSWLEHLNSECTVERFDGIDLDAVIVSRMRLWYLAMLDAGDHALVGPPADVRGLIAVDDGGRVMADASVRRIASLRLESWERGAEVDDGAAVAGRIALQDNPYSAAGRVSPLAWRDRGGTVRGAPRTAGDLVTEAYAWLDPGEDTYILDERALETIPTELTL